MNPTNTFPVVDQVHTTINIGFFYHSGSGNILILQLCVLGKLIMNHKS